jgi:hypothetical protein
MVDTMTYDGLISGLTPEAKVKGVTIRKLGAAATLVRGTILAKSTGTAGDNKFVILGSTAAENETLTADCILADDIEVGTAADVNAAVYDMGCFDPAKLTVKSDYTITEADKDVLRERGIYLAAKSAN